MAEGERACDIWADWLLSGRFGGDPDVQRRVMEQLRGIRDEILDQADPLQDRVVLDVGCGDGLVAFGALERGVREVVFSDVSEDLLDESRRLSAGLEVADRCRFVRAAAEDLSPLKDESVDVVTVRSVLIYVEDKRAAFGEFHRVLRPGGRLSMFEPINRLNRFLRMYDDSEVEELEDRVKGVFEKLQPRDHDPMLNFDDRDLVDHAEGAGFNPVALRLEVKSESPEPMGWDAYRHRVEPESPDNARGHPRSAERGRAAALHNPHAATGRTGAWTPPNGHGVPRRQQTRLTAPPAPHTPSHRYSAP